MSKFVGPTMIIKRVGAVAYKLELLHQWRVHNVFHVSLRRKYVTRGSQGFVAAPPVEWFSGEPVYEVESVLDHHTPKPRGRNPKSRAVETQFLIK